MMEKCQAVTFPRVAVNGKLCSALRNDNFIKSDLLQGSTSCLEQPSEESQKSMKTGPQGFTDSFPCNMSCYRDEDKGIMGQGLPVE